MRERVDRDRHDVDRDEHEREQRHVPVQLVRHEPRPAGRLPAISEDEPQRDRRRQEDVGDEAAGPGGVPGDCAPAGHAARSRPAPGQRPTRTSRPVSVTSIPASPRCASIMAPSRRPATNAAVAPTSAPRQLPPTAVTRLSPPAAGSPVSGLTRWCRSTRPCFQRRRSFPDVASAPRTSGTTGPSGLLPTRIGPRPPAGRQAVHREIAAGAHQRRVRPERREQLERGIDRHALRDPAQVEAGPRGERDRASCAVDDDPSPPAAAPRPTDRLGGAGPELVERAVVADPDELVSECGVEETAGRARRGE